MMLNLTPRPDPQAVDAAEAAVAVVQGRLMEALRAKGDLASEIASLKREAEIERGKLEMEVRDVA